MLSLLPLLALLVSAQNLTSADNPSTITAAPSTASFVSSTLDASSVASFYTQLFRSIEPASLQDFCISRGVSNFTQWSSSFWNGGLPVYTTNTRYQNIPGSGSSFPVYATISGKPVLTSYATDTSTLTTETYFEAPDYSYPVAEPCCAKCSIIAQSADIFYWPTAYTDTPTAVIGTQTYIYPSIYASMSGIDAQNMCSSVGTQPPAMKTQIAMRPEDASSIIYCASGSSFTDWDDAFITTIRFEPSDLATCANFTQRGPRPIYTTQVLDGHECFGIKCLPNFAHPPELTAIDPAWNNCIHMSIGAFDPPHTLTPQAGMGATHVNTPSALPQTTSATPAEKTLTPVPWTSANSPIQTATHVSSPQASHGSPPPNTSQDPAANLPTRNPGNSIPGSALPVSESASASNNLPPSTTPFGPLPIVQPVPTTIVVGSTAVEMTVLPSGSGVVIGSSTFHPGGVATISGIAMSIEPTAIVAEGSTIQLPSIITSSANTIATSVADRNGSHNSTGDTIIVPFEGTANRFGISMVCGALAVLGTVILL